MRRFAVRRGIANWRRSLSDSSLIGGCWTTGRLRVQLRLSLATSAREGGNQELRVPPLDRRGEGVNLHVRSEGGRRYLLTPIDSDHGAEHPASARAPFTFVSVHVCHRVGTGTLTPTVVRHSPSRLHSSRHSARRDFQTNTPGIKSRLANLRERLRRKVVRYKEKKW
jgi:hypothetical protein